MSGLAEALGIFSGRMGAEKERRSADTMSKGAQRGASLADALSHTGGSLSGGGVSSPSMSPRTKPKNSGPNLGDAINATGTKMGEGNSFMDRMRKPENRARIAEALGYLAQSYGASPNNPSNMAAQRIRGQMADDKERQERQQMIDFLRQSGKAVPGAEFLENSQIQSMILAGAKPKPPRVGRGGGAGGNGAISGIKNQMNNSLAAALADGTISPEEQAGLDALKSQLNQAQQYLAGPEKKYKPSVFDKRKEHLDALYHGNHITWDQYFTALHRHELEEPLSLDGEAPPSETTPLPRNGGSLPKNGTAADPLGILD
ncbi:hypothetical protein [Thalassobius sp. Cn5-15]|uniref:hypothetical protein n=1 Tax=Thalassobius sp. Cn5-15 TaxID=2917763 RepID=UPI001EF2E1F4|nr:hypothetical protein [Thalassobius sp. Cn5-15]MCG7492463.1 hypothetical protein [Thalassobius sp. Cn5-15]